MLQNKNFKTYPKFRHNLWTKYEDSSEITYLTVSHGTFEVPTEEAEEFLRIRSFCTGYNTIEEIASKSNMPFEQVKAIITSLAEMDILHLPFKSLETLEKHQIVDSLVAATEIWCEQLADTHISRDVFSGKTNKQVFLGFLLETYHYTKAFPEALEAGVKYANGPLKNLLAEYAKQEKGHERFILQTLIKGGLSTAEVEESIPLVSTRTIIFLLKELFSLEPRSVLLVSAIIEADEFDELSAAETAKTIHHTHKFPLNMLDSFFDHVKIDNKFGHHELLKNNLNLLEDINLEILHEVVNKVHDLKHAFDLQKLEIMDYYMKIGNYFPRQNVDFFAI